MKSLRDIDVTTMEGKALMAAMVIITTECRTDKQPDEVVLELTEGAVINAMYPAEHDAWRQNGVNLIAIERQEQIKKHGYTLEDDISVNQDLQLVHAASALIDGGLNMHHACPPEWDNKQWDKMIRKPFKQRLIMAAALLAAHVDILLQEDRDEFINSLKA